MPLTPFHLGPSLLLDVLFKKRINLFAILLGSIIIDLQCAYYLITKGYPYHRFFHTFMGAIILSVLLIILIANYKKSIKKFQGFFRVNQDFSNTSIILGVIIGTFSHILLDSFLYSDIAPLWPILYNPLLGLFTYKTIYLFCMIIGVLGILLYLFNLKK